MKKSRIIPAVMLMLAGVMIGLVLSGQLGWPSKSTASIAPASNVTASLPKSEATAAPAVSGTDIVHQLNDAFIAIAQRVNPSVVTIFSKKEVRVNSDSPFASPYFDNPFRDFFGDDFFNRFFGPRRNDRGNRDNRQILQGMGSGVIVSADGYILTNNHVIDGADELEVMLMGGKRVTAKVIGADPKTDIAVVKVKEDGLQPMPLGDSDKLSVGEWVMAIGSPLSESLNHTVTSGIVSAKGRSQVGLADYEDFIQTDAAINPGNSGGALVNLDGELVGINTAIASRSGGFQGIGFAVPINMARQVMESLIKNGKVIRGWLGVSISDVNENLKNSLNLPSTQGALVNEVNEGSPAAKAGLKAADFIMALDGQPIENMQQLRYKVASMAPGTKVDLKIWRDGHERHVTVELGELPSEPQMSSRTPGTAKSENLGFSVSNLTSELADRFGLDENARGVVIIDIDQNSQAFAAGLREGDLIKAVDKKEVDNIREFNRIVSSKRKGDNVLIYAERRGGSFFVAFPIE